MHLLLARRAFVFIAEKFDHISYHEFIQKMNISNFLKKELRMLIKVPITRIVDPTLSTYAFLLPSMLIIVNHLHTTVFRSFL